MSGIHLQNFTPYHYWTLAVKCAPPLSSPADGQSENRLAEKEGLLVKLDQLDRQVQKERGEKVIWSAVNYL